VRSCLRKKIVAGKQIPDVFEHEGGCCWLMMTRATNVFEMCSISNYFL